MCKFVLCVDDRDYPASLKLGRHYRRLPDPVAEKCGMIRVLDEDSLHESNQKDGGYLYPKRYFKF